MSVRKLYVICNSHMDPIWLWRLREGRSTWLNTCRSVVRMMNKYPMLKFARSSSVSYQWIEESDPGLFREIRRLADAGRWELVGGWVEQSDTIITPGESLIRQAEHAGRYFREKFGRAVRIAYSVDSFGQNCGLPKLLNAAGFDRYVWMRPMEHEKTMPDIFRWRGDDGVSEVLSFRIRQAYCTLPEWREKRELRERIEAVMASGEEDQSFFFGVGDHGGGIYENQLRWLLELAGEYDIEFSTLEHYFDVLEKKELPVLTGEFTHHSPGCYSAVSGIKKQMSRCEKLLFKAEKIVLESRRDPAASAASDAALYSAWEELLFNYFHDVYSGTCVKPPYECEIRDLCGYAAKLAGDELEKQLSRYAAAADTSFLTEGGVMVWNPLPSPVTALVRFNTSRDPNFTGTPFSGLADASGRAVPLQWCRADCNYGPGQLNAVVELPAGGLRTFAYVRDVAAPANVGFARQREVLGRLEFPVLDDAGDTWGHALKALGSDAGSARLEQTEELEDGPVLSRLRCRYRWRESVFVMDIFAYAALPGLELKFRGWWAEREQDLKIQLRTGVKGGRIVSGQAGAVLEREPDLCEQPFIDWCAAVGGETCVGFLSDSIHSYDSVGGSELLRVTLLRPVYYAEHTPSPVHGDEGMADVGEFECGLWLAECGAADFRREMPRMARERLWGAEHFEITAAGDGAGLERDLWSVEPAWVTVSAHYRNHDGETVMHLVNPDTAEAETAVSRNGVVLWRGRLAPCELRLLKL